MEYKTGLAIVCIIMLSLITTSCNQDDDGDVMMQGPPQGESTYDVDRLGIPQLIEADYTEIDSLSRISRFRSGVGHDYSDDFETCRSMKHYYPVPKGTPIFAPVDATVNWMKDEWAGTKIQMNVDKQPAFYVELFHVALDPPLAVGDKVTAGQFLGRHASDQTMSDIAIFVRVPNPDSSPEAQTKFLSYFDLMPDSLFANYQAKGVINRDSCKISKLARDQDPLDCDAPWNGPDGVGNLENWVELK